MEDQGNKSQRGTNFSIALKSWALKDGIRKRKKGSKEALKVKTQMQSSVMAEGHGSTT